MVEKAERGWRWVLDRARERSTWLGVIGLVTAFGIGLSPEQKDSIIQAGVALAGLIATITKD